jgi:anti-sigma factor ChrR (cupin superfamily)
MISNKELHADLDQLVVVESGNQEWQPTDITGVSKKPFEMIHGGGKAREACLYKYQAGTNLDQTDFNGRVEIMVIQGHLTVNGIDRGAGVYVRLAPGAKVGLGSADGCVFFFRHRVGVGNEKSALVLDTNDRSLWQTWGGRGNQKIPLPDPAEPGVGAWLGYMFPEHQAPEHDHPGGEEVLVLNGELADHSATCGSGTWVRYPVGYVHAPVAHKDGVLLLVREGDVRAS